MTKGSICCTRLLFLRVWGGGCVVAIRCGMCCCLLLPTLHLNHHRHLHKIHIYCLHVHFLLHKLQSASWLCNFLFNIFYESSKIRGPKIYCVLPLMILFIFLYLFLCTITKKVFGALQGLLSNYFQKMIMNNSVCV